MKKALVRNLLIVAILATSFTSFVYLQQENSFDDASLASEMELVEEVDFTPDTYFPHIELVKKVVDMGVRVFKVGM